MIDGVVFPSSINLTLYIFMWLVKVIFQHIPSACAHA